MSHKFSRRAFAVLTAAAISTSLSQPLLRLRLQSQFLMSPLQTIPASQLQKTPSTGASRLPGAPMSPDLGLVEPLTQLAVQLSTKMEPTTSPSELAPITTSTPRRAS